MEKEIQRSQIWFPGAVSWELWVGENDQLDKIAEQANGEPLVYPPQPRCLHVLALPADCQVAFPFLSNAKDDDGLVQTAKMHIERQGTGFDPEGVLVEPVFGESPETIARIDAPMLKGADVFHCNTLPDVIVPAATLVPLERNSIAVWEELGEPVAAFERNGKTIFYDKLSGRDSIGEELNRMQWQLQAQGLIEEPECFLVWSDRFRNTFAGSDPEAKFSDRPAPRSPNSQFTMKPSWYRAEIESRESANKESRRKRTAYGAAGAAVILLSALLTSSILKRKRVEREIRELSPVAARVSAIQSRWEEIATAVDPNKSYLETWRNIFNLPSIPGITITELDIHREGIDVTGTSKNANLALRFIEDVTTDESFSEIFWEYNPPQIDRNGAVAFELKGTR